MKNIVLLCFIFFTQVFTYCQQSYWQQQTDYIIDVRLNDTEHTLDGYLKLQYTNNSPDTLLFIWFHLWPNAFKNDRTAFSEQTLQNGRTDFYFSKKEQRGYINRLDFRSNNVTLKTEDHYLYIDVVKVILSQPLIPGQRTEITTPFHVKLPKNFSRSGHLRRSYQVAQWYPKPAVYDKKGWHPMAYLDQGEFYSEFGNFDVRITLPGDYIVAATGELIAGEAGVESGVGSQESGADEASRQNGRSEKVVSGVVKSKSKTRKKSLPPASRQSPEPAVKAPVKLKTLQYKQTNVHDFAWFADKKFIVKHDTIRLPSGRVVKAYVYYTSRDNIAWQNSIKFIKDATRFRSQLLGEYPYDVVSVVEANMGFSGGMEYPTITSISSFEDEKTLEDVIEHEVGHNWFYGILATNERDYPWMDEGMNTYYDARYKEWKYGANPAAAKNRISRKMPANLELLLINAYAKQKMDQPISTSSEEFTPTNYGLIAYAKAALWMKQLEDSLGREQFDSCMAEYYRQWQFRHPYPEDFKYLVQTTTKKDLRHLFLELDRKGAIGDTSSSRKIKPAFLFSFKETNKYHYLNLLPAAGYNMYDGFMVGAAIHNYNLPSGKFQFIMVPLYATSSKKFNGTGQIAYSWFPNNAFEKIQVSINGAAFSFLEGVDSNGTNIYGRFRKVVPSLRFTFKNKSARSTLEKWLEWKIFLFGEQGFEYVDKYSDSLSYPEESSFKNRYVNQLVFNITDHRALYPYDVRLQLQQADGFYRADITANYLFNYANGGGMRMRFFAGKFGLLGSSSSSFDMYRYQPKLTAVTGSDDYLYSNYFIGRNEIDGLASQQVMNRDGFLKLRTDQFTDPPTRSGSWVSAVNFNTTLPRKLIPVEFPLRLFFDIGTYAEAWKKDAAISRFLYVGGLQFSFFKDLLNIYAPVIYSSEFRNNLKTVEEGQFFRRISFSIDMHRFNLRRVNGVKLPL